MIKNARNIFQQFSEIVEEKTRKKKNKKQIMFVIQHVRINYET